MTTDNRTNEQIVAEALDEVWNFPTFSEAMEAAEVATVSLASAGRLAEKPTEAQVEAAARVIWEMDSTTIGVEPPEILEEWESETVRYLELDLAALVAAQEAAPQAESVVKSSYINPKMPDMIRNLWKGDPSENSVRTALKLAGDLIQELIDLKASPLLSSTVDEDAQRLIAWPTVDEVRETFKKSADRLAFDRMIAEVERATAEKAVREMAEYLTVGTVDPAYEGQGNDREFDSGFYQGIRGCRRVLRARAEAYRWKERKER